MTLRRELSATEQLRAFATAKATLDETLGKKQVAHRIAKDIRSMLLEAIITAPEEQVITLIGPAGVGKSLIRQNVEALLLEASADEMRDDPGFLPYISAVTSTGLFGSYSWSDGFARLLSKANEPLVGYKRSFPPLKLDGQTILSSKGLVRDQFRRAFEELIKNRRVRFMFLDEGSAVINETVNRYPLRQFEILKSLAVETGLVIILVGAYDLAGILEGNGQLLRRTHVVHMQRYRPASNQIDAAVAGRNWRLPEESEDVDDLADFADAATTLIRASPAKFDSGILDDVVNMATSSVGCIGILRNWVFKASANALALNGGRVTAEIFEKAAPRKSDVDKLVCEAELGEKKMLDIEESELARRLGIEAMRMPVSTTGNEAPKVDREPRRVGKRGPSRDPIGFRDA